MINEIEHYIHLTNKLIEDNDIDESNCTCGAQSDSDLSFEVMGCIYHDWLAAKEAAEAMLKQAKVLEGEFGWGKKFVNMRTEPNNIKLLDKLVGSPVRIIVIPEAK